MNNLTELEGLAPGALVVAIGPGASGKSTAALTAPVDAVISLDVLRGKVGTGEGDQSATPAAVEQQNRLLDTFLAAGRRVFLDSTNVEPHVRAELVERARRHRRPIVALRFGTDLDTCRARNRSRQEDRKVPDDVLVWQWSLTQQATPQVLLEEGFAAVYEAASLSPSPSPSTALNLPPIVTAPTGATVPDHALSPERIADAVAVLRKAQEGDQEAHRDLRKYFPEYEGLVMQTDHARYLELAANAGLVATYLLIIECGGWGASVETYTSDFELPLASVDLGDYTSRAEAIREAVRAATDNGWALDPEHQWSDFDCGGGEVHIPIHVRPRPATPLAVWFPGDLLSDAPETSGWDLVDLDDWEAGGSYGSHWSMRTDLPLTATAEELRLPVAQALGVAPETIELTPGTYTIDGVGSGPGAPDWRPGPFTYPQFEVRPVQRKDGS